MGVGIEIQGISNIHKSYDRAVTAVRMAMYRGKKLLSVSKIWDFLRFSSPYRDKDILHPHPNELLGPLEHADVKKHNYVGAFRALISEMTAVLIKLRRICISTAIL